MVIAMHSVHCPWASDYQWCKNKYVCFLSCKAICKILWYLLEGLNSQSLVLLSQAWIAIVSNISNRALFCILLPLCQIEVLGLGNCLCTFSFCERRIVFTNYWLWCWWRYVICLSFQLNKEKKGRFFFLSAYLSIFLLSRTSNLISFYFWKEILFPFYSFYHERNNSLQLYFLGDFKV